jgi:DNA-binding transcriptional LysR family regulator
MNLRFLDALIAVFESGSIAEAARRLNITPAGVAQQIRVLESEVGVRLVTRSGRSSRPTAAAAAILERARRIRDEVRDLKAVATVGRLSGELRVAVIPTMLAGFVPDVLSRFTATFPEIQVVLVRKVSAEAYRAVLEEQVDAAITSYPSFAIPKTCEWSLLRDEPYVVIVPANMKRGAAHETLAREPFIRLDRKVHAGRTIDKYLSKHGIRPHERFELDGIDAIAAMVDRGLGVALLPDYAPPWPEGLRIRKIPLPAPGLSRRIGLLWMRGSLRSDLIHAFLQEAARATEVRTVARIRTARERKARGRASR